MKKEKYINNKYINIINQIAILLIIIEILKDNQKQKYKILNKMLNNLLSKDNQKYFYYNRELNSYKNIIIAFKLNYKQFGYNKQ